MYVRSRFMFSKKSYINPTNSSRYRQICHVEGIYFFKGRSSHGKDFNLLQPNKFPTSFGQKNKTKMNLPFALCHFQQPDIKILQSKPSCTIQNEYKRNKTNVSWLESPLNIYIQAGQSILWFFYACSHIYKKSYA